MGGTEIGTGRQGEEAAKTRSEEFRTSASCKNPLQGSSVVNHGGRDEKRETVQEEKKSWKEKEVDILPKEPLFLGEVGILLADGGGKEVARKFLKKGPRTTRRCRGKKARLRCLNSEEGLRNLY